jgi:uroporphyrinogen decarboxylase
VSSFRPALIKTLNGEVSKKPPVWLMRQAGRYLPEYRELRKNTGSFLDLCYSPNLAAEATLQPIKRFGFDAAIIFSDILVIPDALGQPVSFQEGIGPVLDPLSFIDDLKKLKKENIIDRLNPVYEAIQIARADLSKDKSLIGFTGAPWTIATYMIEGGTSRDFLKTKRWAFSKPEEFKKLIDILIDAITEHLISQIEAGADALQIFDSWAGILPEKEFDLWCLRPIKRIVSGVRGKYPGIPIIVFPRLAGERYIKIAEIDGVSAVSLDQTVSLNWAKEFLQSKVTLQGNLDPVYLLAGGRAMREETSRILDAFRNGPFIFNLGHGILPSTPLKHVIDLCEFIAERGLQD